jgi:hypothetical protein
LTGDLEVGEPGSSIGLELVVVMPGASPDVGSEMAEGEKRSATLAPVASGLVPSMASVGAMVAVSGGSIVSAPTCVPSPTIVATGAAASATTG